MDKKTKIITVITTVILILCILIGAITIWVNKDMEKNNVIVEYKDNWKLEGIARPILDKYLEQYAVNEKNIHNYKFKISNYTLKSSSLIAGDNKNFAISVIVEIIPYNSNNDFKIKKSDVLDNKGIIHGEWTLIIRNVGENNYQLLDVLQTDEAMKELNISKENTNIINSVVNTEKGQYKIEDEEVFVCFDEEKKWIQVPVSLKELNYTRDNENNVSLDEGSYFISEKKTAIIDKQGNATISEDMGESWKTVKINNVIQHGRKTAIGFTEDGIGYAIIAGDKAMSFESIYIYTSKNDVLDWTYRGILSKGNDGGSRQFISGAFSNESTGFITTEGGKVYRTTNKGENWEIIKLEVPEELKAIYDTPRIVKFKGEHGEIYFGQGDDGDYKGGKSQCRFVSDDGGLTWKYDGEVV